MTNQTPISQIDQAKNLSEALEIIGVRHVKSHRIEGCRDWFAADGEYLGTYDAFDGWAKLRELTATAERVA